MESFLAELLGLYFIIVGLIVALRRSSLMPAIRELAANRPLLFLTAILELAAGLAIILVFPKVSFSPEGVIALVGWMMTIEGLLYLALPSRKVQKFIGRFNRPGWYLWGGILSIVAGAYLAGTGFGLF